MQRNSTEVADEKPDLHIFSSGMFRPLVVEGSTGRDRIILEGSKPRVVSKYAYIGDYAIMLAVGLFALGFIYVIVQNIYTFYQLFNLTPAESKLGFGTTTTIAPVSGKSGE
ncbi:hypothetical protein HK096_005279 [Nowakowskiella sp. JEL0078]|nr:hypothetical protein HK096_005279 [Nowakowskiella sp. JEL0078]